MARVPVNEDHLAKLYPIVGAIVVYWGLIDMTITHIGLLMLKVLNTPRAARNLPIFFGARLEILETNFKKHPEFAFAKTEGIQVIKLIRNAQLLRDMLIHGAPVLYETEDDTIIYRRIDRLTPGQKRQATYSGHSYSLRGTPVKFSTLEEASDRCIGINGFLDSLLTRLEAL